MGQKRGCFQDPLANHSPQYFHSSVQKKPNKETTTTDEAVPSLPLVALGLRAAEDSAGFLGTFGTLKAAWADEERYPSTLSSSSKLRSAGRRAEHSVSDQSIITAARWRSYKVIKSEKESMNQKWSPIFYNFISGQTNIPNQQHGRCINVTGARLTTCFLVILNLMNLHQGRGHSGL